MVELARRVHLSRTATMARVWQLETNGAIVGYRAEIRWPNETQALCTMLLLSFTTRHVLSKSA